MAGSRFQRAAGADALACLDRPLASCSCLPPPNGELAILISLAVAVEELWLHLLLRRTAGDVSSNDRSRRTWCGATRAHHGSAADVTAFSVAAQTHLGVESRPFCEREESRENFAKEETKRVPNGACL